MCIGIDHCSRKNCLEEERCLFPEEKAKKRVKINPCQFSKKFCTNDRSCEILGQCILDHPLVKKNKKVSKELKQKMDINKVVSIISKLMPSLNKPGKKLKT